MIYLIAIAAFITAVFTSAIQSGASIAFAAIGEVISERAGVINLGLEGLMLVGALTGVIVQVENGNPALALFAAGLAAALLASIHAFLVIGLNSNQIVSGIAISILGAGVTGLLGRGYVGVKFDGIAKFEIPVLKDIPFFGPVLFQQDSLVYLLLLVSLGAYLLINRTRYGLHLRSVGEDPQAAYAQSVAVQRTRVIAVLLGGFLAGIGGGHLSLAYTYAWSERMTVGRGIIAVGLVIVAGWRPLWTLLAAFMFGALTVLHPKLQAAGINVSPYLVKMLPYLFTIVALTLATIRFKRSGQGMPAALMKQFLPGQT